MSQRLRSEYRAPVGNILKPKCLVAFGRYVKWQKYEDNHMSYKIHTA